MAFDAISVRAAIQEIRDDLCGGFVDKIYQSEKDELMFYFRTRKGARRLLLSAAPEFPRLALTEQTRQNPQSPPMFCMLLRKYLSGAKLVSVEQLGFERVADFTFSGYSELGDPSVKHLIVEIMGRYSNIIFTDESMRILDAVRHVDETVSSQRLVLGGLTYELPPPQEKINPLSAGREEFSGVAIGYTGGRLDKYLLNAILGISPLIARELAFRIGERDYQGSEEAGFTKTAMVDELCAFFLPIRGGEFGAYLLSDAQDGRMIDFSPVEIRQYGKAAQICSYESFSRAVEEFYEKKDQAVRLRQKSSDLSHCVANHIERCKKKIALQKKAMEETENKEWSRICGDLLMANIGRIEKGAREAAIVNFYDENQSTVSIPLDESLSAAENAQRYYKKYAKLKVAQVEQAKQLSIAEEDYAYLEEVQTSIENAENEQDLNEIRIQLAEQSYLKLKQSRGRKKGAPANKRPDFLHFRTSDGFDVYVGRNSGQNDYLTLKFANSMDLWFHTKNIPGSHTVIKFGIDKDTSPETIKQAATIAAYYSRARGGNQIPVDYTVIKNVKKPNGAKPGMVIYDHYNTIYVKSDEELVQSLSVEN
jgi:predicted ribosome quality control (RQC) complex YloA/Tae2 family protein